MRYLKIIILGLIATSLMGIGPLIGKNDRDDKVRSSYMILCFKNSMLAGAGSGNHFKIRDQKFVLTAAHVIESCDEVKLIEYDSQTYNLKTVVVDDTLDYAVLKPERELPLKPAKFYRTSPKIAMGIDMVSWPSDYGMVYTTGHLAGSQNSSGASVFADDGSFLGVLHGIKVGYYDPAMPPQLLNGICLVRPLSTISDKDIYEALRDYDGGEARHINH